MDKPWVNYYTSVSNPINKLLLFFFFFCSLLVKSMTLTVGYMSDWYCAPVALYSCSWWTSTCVSFWVPILCDPCPRRSCSMLFGLLSLSLSAGLWSAASWHPVYFTLPFSRLFFLLGRCLMVTLTYGSQKFVKQVFMRILFLKMERSVSWMKIQVTSADVLMQNQSQFELIQLQSHQCHSSSGNVIFGTESQTVHGTGLTFTGWRVLSVSKSTMSWSLVFSLWVQEW